LLREIIIHTKKSRVTRFVARDNHFCTFSRAYFPYERKPFFHSYSCFFVFHDTNGGKVSVTYSA